MSPQLSRSFSLFLSLSLDFSLPPSLSLFFSLSLSLSLFLSPLSNPLPSLSYQYRPTPLVYRIYTYIPAASVGTYVFPQGSPHPNCFRLLPSLASPVPPSSLQTTPESPLLSGLRVGSGIYLAS